MDRREQTGSRSTVTRTALDSTLGADETAEFGAGLHHPEYADVFGSPGEGARAMGVLRVFWPVLILLPLAGIFLGLALPTRLSFSWAMLGLGGTVIGLLAMFWWSEHRLARYILGARGEESVARVLGLLPPEFTVYHSVGLGRRLNVDVDHVVVGPTGVFVVETKNWRGQVTLEADSLRFNDGAGYGDPLRQVYAAARTFRERLSAGTGMECRTQSVVCFASNAFLGARGESNGILVCNLDDILELVTAFEGDGLPPDRLARIRDWMREEMQ